METTTLPALSAVRSVTRITSASSSKPHDDQSAAILSMCKTLNATITKLLFSFTALESAKDFNADSAASSLTAALAASKREELCAKIVEALSGSVERVVRCDRAAIRSSVLRDIRARFAPPEVKKPEMIDQGVQAVRKSAKVSAAAAARDDEILRQLRSEAQPPPPPPPPPSTAAATSPPASAAPATATDADADASIAKQRPTSASLPGIYERQMQWAARAAAKTEERRIEKENKAREAEAAKPKKASNRWSHVESVMRRQRLDSEEEWKADLKERIDSEIGRREQAEARAREEREARERIAEERKRAEELRVKAEQRFDEAHARMVEAERKYETAKMSADEMAKRHAEELEIRSAFGEGGLEVWPMFPGRKVHRVLESDHFDGRVSAEFRVKDAESGERGVSLLMGRLAAGKGSETQAVLFDPKYMSDLDAARWFESNAHRFERAKQRAVAAKERASSAGTKRSSSQGQGSLEPELT